MKRRVVQLLVVFALCASLTSLAQAGRQREKPRPKPPVIYCWEVRIDYQCREDWCGKLEYCNGKVTLTDQEGCQVARGEGRIRDCGRNLKTICCEWSYNKCEAVSCEGSILCDGEILKAIGCYTESQKDRRGKWKVIKKESCVICGERCCEEEPNGQEPTPPVDA